MVLINQIGFRPGSFVRGETRSGIFSGRYKERAGSTDLVSTALGLLHVDSKEGDTIESDNKAAIRIYCQGIQF